MDADSASLIARVQVELRKEAPAGVVLLGGYDVVGSQRVDVLDAGLRARLGAPNVGRDADAFVVWSDDAYGDVEPDGISEMPVSRVPDARIGGFFLELLSRSTGVAGGRFGLLNANRPFANAALSGSDPVTISGPATSGDLDAAAIARRSIYIMLHGDYRNATTFWGEDVTSGPVPAMEIGSIPASGLGTVLAGCCWGALTASDPAFLATGEAVPKLVERSLALSMLKAGATAFVGTTGAHYSPGAAGGFFGGPMHEAFWAETAAGKAPAKALFDARSTYVRNIPHGRTALFNLAVERKIYKQFTCLGLGL